MLGKTVRMVILMAREEKKLFPKQHLESTSQNNEIKYLLDIPLLNYIWSEF